MFGHLATSDNGMIHRPRNNAAYTASLVITPPTRAALAVLGRVNTVFILVLYDYLVSLITIISTVHQSSAFINILRLSFAAIVHC